MCDIALMATYPTRVKYDPDATEKQGTHDPSGEAEFEVFRATDHPELKLWTDGWWWDLTPISSSTGPYGPFDTSTQAYDHATLDGAEDNDNVEDAA